MILFHFNDCDSVYGPCLINIDAKRIGKNTELLRWGNKSSWLEYNSKIVQNQLADYEWKVKTEQFGSFQSNHSPKIMIICMTKLNFVIICMIEYRCKHIITPPAHTTSWFERCFSYNIAKLYNKVSSEMKL